MILTCHLIYNTKVRRCLSTKCYDIVKFYYTKVQWLIAIGVLVTSKYKLRTGVG